MDPERLLEQLESVAENLGIDVRYSALDTDGGPCRIKNRRVIMINLHLPITDKADVLARSLPAAELENVHLAPAVRDAIDHAHRT